MSMPTRIRARIHKKKREKTVFNYAKACASRLTGFFPYSLIYFFCHFYLLSNKIKGFLANDPSRVTAPLNYLFDISTFLATLDHAFLSLVRLFLLLLLYRLADWIYASFFSLPPRRRRRLATWCIIDLMTDGHDKSGGTCLLYFLPGVISSGLILSRDGTCPTLMNHYAKLREREKMSRAT